MNLCLQRARLPVSKIIRINELDNVAVALSPIAAHETVSYGQISVTALQDIPQGHKIALEDIGANDTVIKYGYPIGSATESIAKGAHVHTHNIRTNLAADLTYSYHPVKEEKIAEQTPDQVRSFWGYEREDGRVGIRNELWIVPTVGCVNAVAKAIAEKSAELIGDTVDAVIPYAHPYGCSQMGEDQEHTRKALSDLVKHPNAGGVLVLGLGCENCNLQVIKPYLGTYDTNRIRFLSCQDVEDEVEAGVKILAELAAICKTDKRTEQPLKKLVIGLKCGGSDGLSGITANPVVGAFSDRFIAAGGSTILTEVPEMFGAETILMNRAVDESVFQKTVSLINDFKGYFRANGETISENPSPGNKEGGISTLEDKALGCTQKSGCAPVVDVLRYGERVHEGTGLYLLEAPGNDLVASTALALSGAQLVLFTTGRGTPFASPVPTMKISTNEALARRKSHWIDFDCGRMLTEEITKEALTDELCRSVLAVANGERVKSEQAGYADLAIWKQGVTL
ncbi:MAG: altronate dehydratase [Lachnospiraceae bacterium]|nr:altronate dehydratase [Lachnospiraceae bacterium]